MDHEFHGTLIIHGLSKNSKYITIFKLLIRLSFENLGDNRKSNIIKEYLQKSG